MKYPWKYLLLSTTTLAMLSTGSVFANTSASGQPDGATEMTNLIQTVGSFKLDLEKTSTSFGYNWYNLVGTTSYQYVEGEINYNKVEYTIESLETGKTLTTGSANYFTDKQLLSEELMINQKVTGKYRITVTQWPIANRKITGSIVVDFPSGKIVRETSPTSSSSEITSSSTVPSTSSEESVPSSTETTASTSKDSSFKEKTSSTSTSRDEQRIKSSQVSGTENTSMPAQKEKQVPAKKVLPSTGDKLAVGLTTLGLAVLVLATFVIYKNRKKAE